MINLCLLFLRVVDSIYDPKQENEMETQSVTLTIKARQGCMFSVDWVSAMTRMYLRFAEGMGFTSKFNEFHYVYTPQQMSAYQNYYDYVMLTITGNTGVNLFELFQSEVGRHHLCDELQTSQTPFYPPGIVYHAFADVTVSLAVQESKLSNDDIKETFNESFHNESELLDNFQNQIRTYSAFPMQFVKDHRTGHEEKDYQKVVDGHKLFPFMKAFEHSKSEH